MRGRTQYALAGNICIAPALLLVGVLLIIPMIQNVSYSFTDWDAMSQPEWIGLSNYKGILTDSNFLLSSKPFFTSLYRRLQRSQRWVLSSSGPGSGMTCCSAWC